MNVSPFQIVFALAVIYFVLKIFEPSGFDEQNNDGPYLEGSRVADYPKGVNITELLTNISHLRDNLARQKGDVQAGLPYLDSNQYLSVLSTYASLVTVNRALVITGSRGAGKSEGILKMIPAWKRNNHIVLDFNFNHVGTVTNSLAQEIGSLFPEMSETVQECYHKSMVTECGVSSEFKLQAGQYGSFSIPVKHGDYKWILLLLLAVVFMQVPAAGLLGSIWGYFNSTVRWIFIIFTVIAFIAIVLYFLLSQWIWIDALQELVKESGLRALTCACKVISKCFPNHQPILIVRHYPWNNESNTLFRILRDGMGTYPMIIEASDFRWETTSAVMSSKEYFIRFHLEDMSFEEGKNQLVDKYHVWSLAEYEKVYNTTGGHMASLRLLYDYHKLLNMSLDKAISELNEQAFNRIVDAFNEINRTKDILGIMNVMINKGYAEMMQIELAFNETGSLMTDIMTLLDKNIFFVKAAGGKLYLQNKLVEWGIKQALNI